MAVALMLEVTLKPGTAEPFAKRLRRHAATCLAIEPGCRQFDVLVPQEGTDTVCAYEVYDDDAALEAHWASDHMQAYRADVGDMITNRRVNRCDLIEN